MLFNSIEFAIFLPLVFIVYWFVVNKNITAQNIFIVIVSYIFYGWWDWRFLSLIIISSFTDFLIGLGLARYERSIHRKILLFTSIFVNIGFLAFFKYYNFFVSSFVDAFTFFGKSLAADRLNIILPVGISFYTFQTLSYSIDVYRKKLEPTKNIFAFFAFVSFFPQLVAGPIERATNLLPQFYSKRYFDYTKAVDGLRQILWGLFKKVVIADNCALFVNDIFANYDSYSGSTLLVGAFLFSFQIYGDFSGYSDIAIGTSRLFGINLKQNFAFPFFSRDIAEYWRKWHISLTSWFKDYIYIPMGGSRVSNGLKIRNIYVIFLVSGLWHGANWTFIIYGAIHATLFIPIMLTRKNRKNNGVIAPGKFFPGLKDLTGMAITFFATSVARIFFRSMSLNDAVSYFSGIFSKSLFSLPEKVPNILFLILFIFLFIEWVNRDKQHGLQITKSPIVLRWGLYIIIGVSVLTFIGRKITFIYFQF